MATSSNKREQWAATKDGSKPPPPSAQARRAICRERHVGPLSGVYYRSSPLQALLYCAPPILCRTQLTIPIL